MKIIIEKIEIMIDHVDSVNMYRSDAAETTPGYPTATLEITHESASPAASSEGDTPQNSKKSGWTKSDKAEWLLLLQLAPQYATAQELINAYNRQTHRERTVGMAYKTRKALEMCGETEDEYRSNVLSSKYSEETKKGLLTPHLRAAMREVCWL